MPVAISGLPAAADVDSDDLIPVVRDGTTSKATASQVLAGASGVVGPASGTDNAAVRFDGATGKLVQDGPVIISDAGAITGVASIAVSGNVDGRDLSVDGTKLDGIEAGADVTDAANVGPLTRATLETLAGTSDTLADADHGKVIRCTSGSAVTITVPSGLTAGVTVEYLQEGVGQVTLVGSGVTLRHSADFDPATAAQWSAVVVTILDTDEALVRGDLAAA